MWEQRKKKWGHNRFLFRTFISMQKLQLGEGESSAQGLIGYTATRILSYPGRDLAWILITAVVAHNTMERFQMTDLENVALYYTDICCWCISLGQHPCQIIHLNSPMLLEFTNFMQGLRSCSTRR